jgi:CRISPR-associated protein Csm1
MIFKIGRWFYNFPQNVEELHANLRNDSTSRGWIVKDGWEVQPYLISRPVSPLSLGNYHPELKEMKKEERDRLGVVEGQKAFDFSNLARASIGSRLIGVLRMDVDNLGELFTRKISEEATIPVRTSALSRLLTRFFTDFINALCEGLPRDQDEPFWLLPEKHLNKPSKKRCVTVVYSGGDDLFIVGAWSEVIELAFDIHTAFRHYVSDHPDITLSGGMVVQPENFPLYQMAELAKKAEEKAKENKDSGGKEKNSFAPFYLRDRKAFSWKQAEILQELAVTLVKNLQDNEVSADNRLYLNVPHALLTQLFEVVEIYKQEGKLYLPRLAYLLAHDKITKELKQKLLSLDTINYLHPVLIWLELLSRGEGTHVGS